MELKVERTFRAGVESGVDDISKNQSGVSDEVAAKGVNYKCVC